MEYFKTGGKIMNKKFFRCIALAVLLSMAFAVTSYAKAIVPDTGDVLNEGFAGNNYSSYWKQESDGNWCVIKPDGTKVKNCWLCDDAVEINGKNSWYLIDADGHMYTNGLIKDKTGNYYSLETAHNGRYGRLRYLSGMYNCNGTIISIYIEADHNDAFGAILNENAIEELKKIYGVTTIDIGNESCVYTSEFEKK